MGCRGCALSALGLICTRSACRHLQVYAQVDACTNLGLALLGCLLARRPGSGYWCCTLRWCKCMLRVCVDGCVDALWRWLLLPHACKPHRSAGEWFSAPTCGPHSPHHGRHAHRITLSLIGSLNLIFALSSQADSQMRRSMAATTTLLLAVAGAARAGRPLLGQPPSPPGVCVDAAGQRRLCGSWGADLLAQPPWWAAAGPPRAAGVGGQREVWLQARANFPPARPTNPLALPQETCRSCVTGTEHTSRGHWQQGQLH